MLFGWLNKSKPKNAAENDDLASIGAAWKEDFESVATLAPELKRSLAAVMDASTKPHQAPTGSALPDSKSKNKHVATPTGSNSEVAAKSNSEITAKSNSEVSAKSKAPVAAAENAEIPLALTIPESPKSADLPDLPLDSALSLNSVPVKPKEIQAEEITAESILDEETTAESIKPEESKAESFLDSTSFNPTSFPNAETSTNSEIALNTDSSLNADLSAKLDDTNLNEVSSNEICLNTEPKLDEVAEAAKQNSDEIAAEVKPEFGESKENVDDIQPNQADNQSNLADDKPTIEEATASAAAIKPQENEIDRSNSVPASDNAATVTAATTKLVDEDLSQPFQPVAEEIRLQEEGVEHSNSVPENDNAATVTTTETAAADEDLSQLFQPFDGNASTPAAPAATQIVAKVAEQTVGGVIGAALPQVADEWYPVPVVPLLDENELRCQEKWLRTQIAAHPFDFKLHLERVNLLVTHGMGCLFSAFVDLFLALGPKGAALRQNLLTEQKARMSADHYNFLQEHLLTGIHPNQILPDAPASVLARGLVGSIELYKRGRADLFLDLQEEDYAHLHWQAGDYEAACDLMENAVLNRPSDMALRHELLTFYQDRRDFKRFSDMKIKLNQKLTALGEPLPLVWLRLI